MSNVDPIPALKRDAAANLVVMMSAWNAGMIAYAMGTDQPRVSDIKRGKLDRFSLETLIRFLTRLDCTVELRVTYPARGIFRPPPR